jgi:hypothetical protein
MSQEIKYHIILLPRENYWGWVEAVREYAVRFSVTVTPSPENAVRFHRPEQVVTIVSFPGAYATYGDDILAWFRANAPGIQVDPISVNSPDRLRGMLEQRVQSGLRLGTEAGTGAEGEEAPFRLLWPVESAIITQEFGVNPDVYRRWGLPGHEGIDFRAPINSEVYACADGTVYQVHDGSNNHNYGIHVRIEHRDGYKTVYCHLNQALVRTGQQVHAGDVIGLADNTGNSTGSHLHLTLKKEGATAANLTAYPNDIIDPTPYLVRPEESRALALAPEWSYGKCLIGLHGRLDGQMEDADWQVLQSANVEALELVSTAAPADVDHARQVNPNMLVVVRLWADLEGRMVRAADFVSRAEDAMSAFYSRQVRYFEVHHQPNLTPEGAGTTWANGLEFGEWFLEVVGLLKARFPEALFGWPGLSPGPGIVGMRQGLWEFMESAGQIVDQADWIGCHCYWQDEAQMFSNDQGLLYRAYRERWPRKLIMITEFSNNASGVDMHTKGTQYLKYYRHLREQPGVGAAFAFVASAAAGYSTEVWRDEAGQPNAIPGIIGSRSF